MRPSSPKPTRILLTCTQQGCGKKFGKHAKLERHLIDVHGATLRISPELLTIASNQTDAPVLARAALSAAVAAFDAGLVHCPHCSGKEFRNHSDLARHLVEKHSQQLLCNMAELSLQTVADSQRSSKHLPKAKEEQSVQHTNKRSRDTEPISNNPVQKKQKLDTTIRKPNENNNNSSNVKVEEKSSVITNQEITTEITKKNLPTKSIRTTASSGSKPPITPKRSKANTVVSPKESAKRAAAARGNENNIQKPPAPITAMRAARPLAPVTLDFSNVGMFAINARKSYYRLVDR